MPTNADLIEDFLVTKLRQIAGLEDALDHEPQALPRALPVTTLLFLPPKIVRSETGPGEDVTYRWRLTLYVALQDFKRAQQSIKDLLPLVIKKVRDNAQGGGLCDELSIDSDGDEPVFAVGTGGYLRQSMIVSAVLTET